MTVAPSISRLENFRMAIEIDDTRTRERWWCQNEVKKLYRKQVRILVNANTTSQNALSRMAYQTIQNGLEESKSAVRRDIPISSRPRSLRLIHSLRDLAFNRHSMSLRL